MVSTSLKETAQPRFYQPTLDKIWLYIVLSGRCLVDNPRLFLMRKLARIEFLRYGFAKLSAWASPSRRILKSQPSLVSCPDFKTLSADLRQKGLYAGLQLSPKAVVDLVTFAHQQPFAVDRNPDLLCRYDHRAKMEAKVGYAFKLGSFSTQDCPAIQELINDPSLLAIATDYLGAHPKVLGSELLWSFPTPSTRVEQVKVAQVFHYDIDDYRSLKFFFYLTDVDEQSGPHVCIQGSHRGKKLKHQLIGQRCAGLSEQTIVETYGADQVASLCGKAGFGIAEDPFCFHKGTRPITRPRLMLQIQYALHHYGEIRRYQS